MIELFTTVLYKGMQCDVLEQYQSKEDGKIIYLLEGPELVWSKEWDGEYPRYYAAEEELMPLKEMN